MADQRRINGAVHTWSDIYFKIRGKRFYGIKSIGYGDSRKPSPVYGSGRHYAPIGMTAGKYEVEPCTVSMLKATAASLRKFLADNSPTGAIGDAEVQIVVMYKNNVGDIYIDTCEYSRYVSTSSKGEDNNEPIYDDIEFQPRFIRWDGRTLFDASEGSP